MPKYLIWSFEHRAWWAPDRRGYTGDAFAAGQYDEDEARQIVEDANIVGINECVLPLHWVSYPGPARRRVGAVDASQD